MSHAPKVVFWNHVPATAAVGRFNAVARRGNLDFEVWFSELESANRRWNAKPASWEFRSRLLKERSFLGKPLKAPFAELHQSCPDLLIGSYDSIGHVLGLFAASHLGSRIAFRFLPSFDAWFPRRRWKETLKSFLFRAADGAKVSGQDAKALAVRYGMPVERIATVTQSIDFGHYATAISLRQSSVCDRRTKLGLEGCTFVYVGRLWRGKGLDDLFEAYTTLRSKHDRVSLLIVGEGVDSAFYREKYKGVQGIRFAGHVKTEDLPEYYAAADVMVFPTLGDPHGVVVEEAMAAGLPILSTTAAGDITRRVPDGSAGFLVPPRAPMALAEKMLFMARNLSDLKMMGNTAHQIAQGCDHGQYAVEFEKFVEVVLSQPRRATTQARIARAIGRTALAISEGGAPADFLSFSRSRLDP